MCKEEVINAVVINIAGALNVHSNCGLDDRCVENNILASMNIARTLDIAEDVRFSVESYIKKRRHNNLLLKNYNCLRYLLDK
jgi:hypothetical protein